MVPLHLVPIPRLIFVMNSSSFKAQLMPLPLKACKELCLSSVQFSHSVVSDTLWPHESQHTRPPCPSPTPGVYSNSCPSSRWCHPAISSSVAPFSSCPQSLPASGSFPMSQLFTCVSLFLNDYNNSRYKIVVIDTSYVPGTVMGAYRHEIILFLHNLLNYPYLTDAETEV